NNDIQGNEKITASRTATFGNAAALDPEYRASLRSGGNVQFFLFAFESRNHDLRAKSGLREADGNIAVQIRFAPLEKLVFLYIQDNVEITCGTTRAAGITFTRDA